MTRHMLLATVAALTLASATGVANAQSPGGMAPPAAAPAGEMKKPEASPAAKEPAKTQSSAPSSDAKPGAAAQDAQSAPKQAQDSKSAPQQAQDKPAAGSKAAGDNKAGTTGAAPSGAAAAPPPEKRSQIATAIKQEKIKEVTNVNFNISIGARVPSTVEFYPLPSRIVEIYPEWRGYRVILVSGRYVIVRPTTYEIVYIIEG